MKRFIEDENKNLVLEDGTVIPKEYRTRAETYSRVVGYMRPVSQWNEGKKQEYIERVVFKTDIVGDDNGREKGDPQA